MSNKQYSHVPSTYVSPAEVPTEEKDQSDFPPHAATNSNTWALGTDATITKKPKQGHAVAPLPTPGTEFDIGATEKAGITASHKRPNVALVAASAPERKAAQP